MRGWLVSLEIGISEVVFPSLVRVISWLVLLEIGISEKLGGLTGESEKFGWLHWNLRSPRSWEACLEIENLERLGW